MSTDKTPTNVRNILDAIDTANKQVGYDIWIPSLNKNIQFSGITTGQQKQMIRALVDNPIYRTNFIIAMYDIIKNNCIDKSVDVCNLFIDDKIAIALQLRKFSIGNIVKVQDADINYVVDLNSVDYKTKFVHSSDLFDEHTFKTDKFSVVCKAPTILRELQLEKEVRTKLDSSKMETYEDVRNVLSDAYIGELAKHLSSLQVIDHGEIELANADFKTVYSVVEKLPAQLVKDIIAYMEQLQQYVVSLTTVKGKDNNNTEVDVEITIDAAFFTGK
jgi:hypothetical protein